jgi:hypothetical protein
VKASTTDVSFTTATLRSEIVPGVVKVLVEKLGVVGPLIDGSPGAQWKAAAAARAATVAFISAKRLDSLKVNGKLTRGLTAR